MNLQEVQAFLDQNKDKDDVKKFIGGFYVPDKLNSFLDSDEGSKILQPRLDKHFNKGLETWKTNHFSSAVEEEIKKRFPAETEEQKRIRKIEKELEDSKAEANKAILKNLAISKFTESKLPVKLADFFIGSDETSTLNNIKSIQDHWDKEINSRVDEKFKANGRQKPGEKKDVPGDNSSINRMIREAAGKTSAAN